MNKPLVSILICTYNRADYLDECLYSVLSQDVKDYEYEIVIRDNCSDDHTQVIVKKYEPLFNIGANYRYVRNEVNVGFIKNMHDGITKDCKGKYCINLADDDFLITDKLLKLYVQALETSDDIAFVTSGIIDYNEGNEFLKRPKDIIKNNNAREINVEKSIINGNEYFLNFWSKYQPIVFSATMFRKELALGRNWSKYSCLDQSLALLLSLNKRVVIYHDKFVCYRTHNKPKGGEPPERFAGLQPERVWKSHSMIDKWAEFAKKNIDISKISLLVWRLKNSVLKSNGPIRWLHEQSEVKYKKFLDEARRHSQFHYLTLRYLSPQIIKYDYASVRQNKSWLIRTLGRIFLFIRRRILGTLLGIDRGLHDSECPDDIMFRFLRFVSGVKKLSNY